MSTSEHRVPVEVWLNVFDQIQNNQNQRGPRVQEYEHLKQCKLVCKRWAPLAEMTMLKTVILSDTNTPRLYQHLLNNPDLIRHVHCINFQGDFASHSPELEGLLKMVLTSNLRAITGFLNCNLLAMFLEILLYSVFTPLKLEQVSIERYVTETPIANGTSITNGAPIALLYLLRDTLKSMAVAFRREEDLQLVSSLTHLNSLIKLRIMDDVGRFFDLKSLDSVLNNCKHLKALQLDIKRSNHAEAEGLDLKTWLSKEVSKVESMQSLTFKCVSTFGERRRDASGCNINSPWYVAPRCNINILWYLAYKYPNLDFVCLKDYEYEETHMNNSIFKDVETVQLENWSFNHWEDVSQIIHTWKSQANSISIKYDDSIARWGYGVCYMNMIRSKQRDHTGFKIDSIDRHTKPAVLRQIVALLGASVIKKLELDMTGYLMYKGHEPYGEERFSPATFIQGIPLLESLKLNANYLDCDNVSALTRLHTLELGNMYLTAKEIAYLGQLFPSLQHLTFSSCQLDTFHKSRRHIDLPTINLQTLTLQLANSESSEEVSITGDALIHISTERCHPISFFSRPNKPLLRLSEDGFDQYSQHVQLISIHCQSLGRLKVNLGGVKLELKFDDQGKVKYSTPSIIDSGCDDIERKDRLLGG